MCKPIVFFGQGFIDAVVEVFVVREDDMAADVIQLFLMSDALSFMFRKHIQILPWSHLSRQDRQESRSSPQSTTMGHSGGCQRDS